MKSEPTYPLVILEELVPLMQLPEVKKVTDIIRQEKLLYKGYDYNKAVVLISRRLAYLGRQILP